MHRQRSTESFLQSARPLPTAIRSAWFETKSLIWPVSRGRIDLCDDDSISHEEVSMRRSIISALSATLLAGALCTTASAQSLSPSDLERTDTVDLPSGIDASPEMWMYLHEYKRSKDPREAIRAKAITKAKQRRARLESQKWYGLSKSRPGANAMPQMSVFYGQQWGGLAWSPNQWTPYATHRSYYGGSSRRYYTAPVVRIADR